MEARSAPRSRPCSVARSRPSASWRCWRRRPCRGVRRGLAAHRPARRAHRPAGAGGRRLGPVPRWARGHQGAPLFRASPPDSWPCAGQTTTATSAGTPTTTSPPSAADELVAGAVAAGVERMVSVGTDVARSCDAIAAARRHPGRVWATVGLHPHEARQGVDGLEALGRARGGGRGGVRPRLLLRALAPRGPAGRLRRPDRPGQGPRPGAGHPHATPGPRRSTCWSPRACPSARCCTASPAGPPRPGAASTWAPTCRSRAS